MWILNLTRILNVYAFRITHLIPINLINILLAVYDTKASDMLGDVKNDEIILLDKVADTIFSLEENEMHSVQSFNSPVTVIEVNEFFLSRFSDAKNSGCMVKSNKIKTYFSRIVV